MLLARERFADYATPPWLTPPIDIEKMRYAMRMCYIPRARQDYGAASMLCAR